MTANTVCSRAMKSQKDKMHTTYICSYVWNVIRLCDAELIQLVYAKSSRLVYPNDVRVTFIRITTNSPTDISSLISYVSMFVSVCVCGCTIVYVSGFILSIRYETHEHSLSKSMQLLYKY